MAKGHINLDEMNVSEMVADIIEFQQKHLGKKKSDTSGTIEATVTVNKDKDAGVTLGGAIKAVVGAVMESGPSITEESSKDEKKKDKKKDKDKSKKKDKSEKKDKKKKKSKKDKDKPESKDDKKAKKKQKKKEQKAYDKMVDKSVKKLKQQEAYEAATVQSDNDTIIGDFVLKAIRG